MGFLHGVELQTFVTGAVGIQDIGTSVIGLIGTAKAGPVSDPVLVTTAEEGVAVFGERDTSTTIVRALEAIFAQGSAAVVVIRVEGADGNAVRAAMLASSDTAGNKTGIAAFRNAENKLGVTPKILIAPGYTHRITAAEAGSEENRDANKAVVDLLTTVATSFRGQVIIDGPNTTRVEAIAYRKSVSGSRKVFMCDPWVRVFEPIVGEKESLLADAKTRTQRKDKEIKDAQNEASKRAREADDAKAAESAAKNASDAAPNDEALKRAAAEAKALSQAAANNKKTADAFVTRVIAEKAATDAELTAAQSAYDAAKSTSILPPSAHIAGLIARVDKEEGYWVSPSNHEIRGILGTARPVEWSLEDQECEANRLNADQIATIVRLNGWRLWGNRTLASASETRYSFITTSRICDAIDDSILRAHVQYIDRNINKAYFEVITDSVNSYLRLKAAEGSIVGGKCWADPKMNTPEKLSQGQATIDYEFTETPTGERITFRRYLTNKYLSEVLP